MKKNRIKKVFSISQDLNKLSKKYKTEINYINQNEEELIVSFDLENKNNKSKIGFKKK